MRVLAEEGVLLALGTVLAVMTGIRTDAVFIAGLLLAVSVTGLVEWLHADERWPWLPCVAYLIVAAAVPAWCSFMPLVAYDMARLAAAGRPSRLVTAVRWLWVLPFAALWFVRVSHAGVAAGAADANSHMQALALTLTALLGFVAGRSREASDGNRRALLHAQDMAREASRSVRSRIADIDEERAQSVRMATLGERTRIAREIHDNVGHLLTRAIMQAQAGRAVAEATDDEVAARGFTTLGETLDDAMTMVRRSVHDLEDDGTDFAAQIEAAVASFDGISPDFSVSLANDVGTAPAPVSRCFATVIREALANVAHHSEAQEASVTLETILTATGTADVLWSANDGGAAIRRYFESPENHPDILLIDIQMPGMNGLDAAREILTKDPAARILFLTTFSDQAYIEQAMRLGTKGYLIKQDVAAIAPALHAVMAGQVVLGADVIGKLTGPTAGTGYKGPDDASDTAGDGIPHGRRTSDGIDQLLNERERDIAALVAEGLDNRDIAAKLYLSEGTVRNRISAMLDKLALTNRTQLAIAWLNTHR